MRISILIFLLLSLCNSGIAQNNRMGDNQMLKLVNDVRSKGCNCGDTYMPPAPALKWNDKLKKAAWLHSNDMNSKNYFNHVSPNGRSTPRTRLHKAKYNWSATAENIAYGQMTVKELVKGWIDSPSHCLNIMNPVYTEMGSAVKGIYWTQVFGKPKAKK